MPPGAQFQLQPVRAGSPLSALAGLFIMIALLVGVGLAIDAPAAIANGLPRPEVRERLADVFGTEDWADPLRHAATAAGAVVLFLGVSTLIFARRNGGFFHIVRGLIGTAGLFVSLGPVYKLFVGTDFWPTVAENISDHHLGPAIEAALVPMHNRQLLAAAGVFLFSVLMLAWSPKRRAVYQAV
jgi:hypothetical protein